MVFQCRKLGLKRSLPLIDNSRKVLSKKQFGSIVCSLVRQNEGGKQ
jgi:hypothetical protein